MIDTRARRQTFASLLQTLAPGQGDRRGFIGVGKVACELRLDLLEVVFGVLCPGARRSMATLGSLPVSGKFTASQLVAFRSALTGISTSSILSWLVWRWRWLCFEWQCRLLWCCQQRGEHGVQMARTKFLRCKIEKSGVRLLLEPHAGYLVP